MRHPGDFCFIKGDVSFLGEPNIQFLFGKSNTPHLSRILISARYVNILWHAIASIGPLELMLLLMIAATLVACSAFACTCGYLSKRSPRGLRHPGRLPGSQPFQG